MLTVNLCAATANYGASIIIIIGWFFLCLLSAFEIFIRLTQPLPMLCLYPSEVSVTIIFKLLLSSMVHALNTLSRMDLNTSDTNQQWQSLVAFGSSQGSHRGHREDTTAHKGGSIAVPSIFTTLIQSFPSLVELCRAMPKWRLFTYFSFPLTPQLEQKTARKSWTSAQDKFKQWLFGNWYDMMSCAWVLQS